MNIKHSLSKAARDFFWTIQSSSVAETNDFILADQFFLEASKRMERAVQMSPDGILTDLEELQQNRPPRLGFYFEKLVGIWLRHDPAIEVLASGLQVKSGKTTLGEFDFVLYNQLSQQHEHWEVAVKFYLLTDPDLGLNAWKGTYPYDTLKLKLDKMIKRQLCLSQTPEGQRALSSLSLDSIAPRLMLKGQLFYPLHHTWKKTPVFQEINPLHQKGWWCYMERFDHGGRDRYWLALNKSDWFSTKMGIKDDDVWNGEELNQHYLQPFAQSSLAFMIAELHYQEGEWIEWTRGFVVGSRWPDDYKRS